MTDSSSRALAALLPTLEAAHRSELERRLDAGESAAVLLAEVEGDELLVALGGRPSRSWRYIAPLALVAAAALLVVLLVTIDNPLVYDGIKGTPDASMVAPLRVFVQQDQVRELAAAATLPAHSQVLFRFRLVEPAYASLIVQEADLTRVVWTSPELLPAGEHEVVDQGSAMAWDLDSSARFAVWTSKDGAVELPVDLDDHCTPVTCPILRVR